MQVSCACGVCSAVVPYPCPDHGGTGTSVGPKACRAATPIPNSGQWFFEVTPQASDSVLGGNTFLGICTEQFSCFDGAWWGDEKRADYECHVVGMWDRGNFTRPSHDRQRDWFDATRFLSGDTLGFLCDMDRRSITFYRNGELLKDPAGHYQAKVCLGIPSADSFWPLVVLGDRFQSAKLTFRPMWVQILQSSLPEHFPKSPEHACIGSPIGRLHYDDDDGFVGASGVVAPIGSQRSKNSKSERDSISGLSSLDSSHTVASSHVVVTSGSSPGISEIVRSDVAGQDRLASRGNEPKQKKNSRRRKQLQAVQVGQRMELSDQGREYDQKVWGNLARGGQGSVTQVNPEQDVCWVMWDATRQTGDTLQPLVK